MRPALQTIVDDFADTERELRLELLLEHADTLPPLPERIAADRGSLERVHECQTPLFVQVELEGGGPPSERTVRLHFDAPPEAPTTRGFAGVLHAGLDGATVQEVLDTPGDFYTAMRLGDVVSPLRLRGLSALLAIIKRQVQRAVAA